MNRLVTNKFTFDSMVKKIEPPLAVGIPTISIRCCSPLTHISWGDTSVRAIALLAPKQDSERIDESIKHAGDAPVA